jgi:hypothetical protein
MLKQIFASKLETVTGSGRILHNKERYNLYTSETLSVIKSRKMEWGHLEPMGDTRNTYAYAGKREQEKPFIGLLEDNIKMDLKNRRLVVCASELCCSG